MQRNCWSWEIYFKIGLQIIGNHAILCKVRGIGAAGSAFASHVKGRGFESHMLHF